MKRLFLLLVGALFAICGQAQFSGSGSGTETDPYLIFNASQLNQVRNFLNNTFVYFKLMDDIDLTDWIAENNPEEGWVPIGLAEQYSCFCGKFNGNNHTIKGLYINRPKTGELGLFGAIEYDATLSNLSVEGTIIGSTRVGGLVGLATRNNEKYPQIINCSFSGKITAKEQIGGLVGCGCPNCTNCITKCTISGNSKVGGLIGCSTDSKTIKNCKVIGNLTASFGEVGGLIGCNNADILSINNSWALCNISTDSIDAGGIIGNNQNGCFISDCYFNGHIIGLKNIGGIIGDAASYCSIVNCYSAGTIRGKQYIGGILGYSEGESTIHSNMTIENEINATNCDAHRIVGGCSNLKSMSIGPIGSATQNMALTTMEVINNGSKQSITDDLLNGTSVGISTLKLKETYMGIGWDFSKNWSIQETECFPFLIDQTAPPVIQCSTTAGSTSICGKSTNGGTVFVTIGNNTYSCKTSNNLWNITTDKMQAGDIVSVYAIADTLQQSYCVTQYVTFPGQGTKANPYLIYNADDLQRMYGFYYYKLMNNIDLTSWINNHSTNTGWIPVGKNNYRIKYFDGNGHTISGLWTNDTTEFIGLFSNLSNDTIANLTIKVAENKTVKGGDYTGILAGKNQYGAILNCSMIGDVIGTKHVGGILGESNLDQINNCSYTGNISGTKNVGMIGISTSNIEQCSALGNITATGIAGGIVGTNSGSITNCYSNTKITSTEYAAGIAGYNYGTINKCYAIGDITSTNIGAGISGYNDNTLAITSNCTAINHIISITKSTGIASRVIGGIRNNAPAPAKNNDALKTMAVSVNNVPQVIYDDILNGIAKTESETKLKSTYEALGWDMTNIWDINDGISYPFLRNSKNNSGTSGNDSIKSDSTLLNSLAIHDSIANSGSQIKIPVYLTNKDSITAFQFDLYLPKGISIATNEDNEYLIEVSNRTTAAKHTISYATQADGGIRFVGLSFTNAIFKGHSGPAFYLTVNVADSMTDGDYTILMKNIKLSTPKAFEYDIDESKSKITISSFQLGDVDNNKQITISDAVAIINNILNNANAVFIFKAADLDKNNSITVSDAVLLIRLILGESIASSKAYSTKISSSTNTADLQILPFSISAGEEKEIQILLNNPSDKVTAFQFDIALPNGITLVSDNNRQYCQIPQSDRLSSTSHLIDSKLQNNGDLRVACLSFNNTAINGISGPVATIRIKASDNLNAGTYYLDLKNKHIAHVNGLNEINPENTLSPIYTNVTDILSSETDHLAIFGERGKIIVKCTLQTEVKIYSVDGKLIEHYLLNAGQSHITNITKGIYLVNGKKIAVQ